MARIIEITPTGRTAYDMPEELAEVVCHALKRARVINFCPRGVGAIVALFPPEYRAQVTSTPVPVPERVVCGFGHNMLITEDVIAEGTWEELGITLDKLVAKETR